MDEAQILESVTKQVVAPLMRVQRANLVPLDMRKESVADHSFHLACSVVVLAQRFENIDIGRAVRLALCHDLAEVVIGDVSVYAPTEERELKEHTEGPALGKLGSQLVGDGEILVDLAAEYLDQSSIEARFVYALDKIIPYYLLIAGEGHHARPSLRTYLASEARARAKVSASFPALLAVFEDAARRVRERVERGYGPAGADPASGLGV